MVHSAILGHRFQFPHMNLGFSGNGRMEPEHAEPLAEFAPAFMCWTVCPTWMRSKSRNAASRLCGSFGAPAPALPIVLIEDCSFADSFLVASRRERNDTSRRTLKTPFDNLKKSSVKELYSLKGDDVVGGDGEGTVDSSHPTDLGFLRQADAFAEVLGPLLKQAVHR